METCGNVNWKKFSESNLAIYLGKLKMLPPYFPIIILKNLLCVSTEAHCSIVWDSSKELI